MASAIHETLKQENPNKLNIYEKKPTKKINENTKTYIEKEEDKGLFYPCFVLENYNCLKKGIVCYISPSKIKEILAHSNNIIKPLTEKDINELKETQILIYTDQDFKDFEEYPIKKLEADKRNKVVYLSECEDISDIALRVSNVFKSTGNTGNIYLNHKTGLLEEVTEVKDIRNNILIFERKNLGVHRFINLLAEIVDFRTLRITRKGEIEKKADLKDFQAKCLMSNSLFLEHIPKLERVENKTSHYVVNNDLIKSHIGYNPKLQIYVLNGSPIIREIEVSEAINNIKDCLAGFCFRDQVSYIMALSYFLTPYARAFYNRKTCRTPLYIIQANRERAGKDYLAGCVGIIYENTDTEQPPISDLKTNSDDENRKRIFSSLLANEQRYHSSNNKGNINNSFFEGILTNKTPSDRILGSMKSSTVNNEIDFSLSGNIGLTYSPDLHNRARVINLFFGEEDANAREFPIPDLKGYIRKNREKILSSIDTLFISWYKAGMPEYENVLFSSFPEWARVVGGVMSYHNLGNPTLKQEYEEIGGDTETQDMKKLFRYCKDLGHPTFTAQAIREEINACEDLDILNNYDFNKKSDQTKFGILIKRYVGRTLGGIKLKLDPSSENQKRASRICYIFEDSRKPISIISQGIKPEEPYITEEKSTKNILESIVQNELKGDIKGEISRDTLSQYFSDDKIAHLLLNGYLINTKTDIFQIGTQ